MLRQVFIIVFFVLISVLFVLQLSILLHQLFGLLILIIL